MMNAKHDLEPRGSSQSPQSIALYVCGININDYICHKIVESTS